jgi:hypothetical protein
MDTYKILRGYFNDAKWPTETIDTGISLFEAQARCNGPESSSRTCTEPENVARTKERGPWFERYEKE